MVVQLDPKYEAELAKIAARTGSTVTEVVERAVERVIQEQNVDSAKQMPSEKKAAMLARFEELRAMATPKAPDDSLTSDDHDAIIYGLDS